jgi:4-amino-4-deoxy-L-arabinose transferase-like glycosyltransferase
MLFSASIALAMASAATVLRRAGYLRADALVRENQKPGDAIPLFLFGVFLGLGVLAKGPAAILLAGGAVALWTLFTKNWRPAFRLAHPYAILAFCVVALPWYVLCSLRNPDFLHVFIFQHNFERYLTPVFQHRQPFWFFGPITLLALLPWTALLWPMGREGLRLWREKSWSNSPGFFFACWAIFPVVFFSFSQSKLPSYILPAIPALALLSAITLTLSTDLRLPGMAVGATFMALGLVAVVWVQRLPTSMHETLYSAVVMSAVIASGVGAGIIFLAVHRNSAFLALSLILVAALVEFAGLGILARIDPYISARWHAQLMHNNLHPDRIFTYRLARSWNYGLAFYFGRELPEWSASDPDPALVLTTPEGLKQIRQAHRFYGDLEETYQGILNVPIGPLPR